MTLHEFTIYLDRQPTDEDLDTLFEAGFDDSQPEVGNGRGMIHVTREADTLANAILSAVDQAETSGFHVTGVEDEDLHSLKTLAERLGRSYESVRLLATGKRGPGGFPHPVGADGWTLYSWAAVADWATAHLGEPINADPRSRTIAAADHLLRARTLVPNLNDLAPLLEHHKAAA
ncbi:MAG: hypothetical protein ACTHW1_08580 [Ancrocorticia sp.]|uniref:hypothetical protein n=1 Tax=Ancrocorticia sp. TaxID=2593684 RepID=UPI003F8F1851